MAQIPTSTDAAPGVVGQAHNDLPLDFYKVEADHFFQAELQHEERGNWLAAIASGVLAFNVAGLREAANPLLSPVARGWLKAATVALAFASVLGIFTLWPLAGRRGSLWNPFRSHRANRRLTPAEGELEVFRAHCEAHRLRARRKARYAVTTATILAIGLVLSFTGWYLAIP